MQATLQRDSPEPEGPVKDDVDMMLDELEQNLDAAALGRRSDLMQVPELADYLKYMKPKKIAAFKGFKRAFFSFRDLYLSYYQTSNDINQAPLGHFSLKGCEVSPDVSVSQGKYQIKLLVPTAEGMTDFVLKCDTEHQYARWMAACRLASRGKSMADSSYPQEVESIKNLLHMQSATNGRNENSTARRSSPVKLPSDFNVDEYVSQRYVRKARSKQALQQRVADAHANVRQLSSTEAKLQYIRAWQALPEHGMHYFIVRFRNGRKADLIGVAINRLVKMNMDNGESIKTWRFANMKKWHVNWEIRHLKIQFEDEDIEFKPLSADCKIVHEFIGGYIFLTMRSKEQNQTLNEELFHKLTGGWG
ncbi:unnamed protein product [Haemonchus placei]|uniref:PH domain-containing protein n=1 Tax=Haemonchus placei TaxID=6290 RepID=A0A3P7SEJ5_HAEPC|nr:unnamed protein product [Haemonchus placei]